MSYACRKANGFIGSYTHSTYSIKSLYAYRTHAPIPPRRVRTSAYSRYIHAHIHTPHTHTHTQDIAILCNACFKKMCASACVYMLLLAS